MSEWYRLPWSMTWSVSLTWLAGLTCIFISSSIAIESETGMCECFSYGPSRMTELTFYYYPRDGEKAMEICRQEGAWLFTDFWVSGLRLWETLVLKYWEPVLKEERTILSGVISVSDFPNNSQMIDIVQQTCPEQVINNNSSNQYVFKAGVASVFGEETYLRTFEWYEHMSLVCARDAGQCSFRIKENQTYDIEPNGLSMFTCIQTTELACLETCLLFDFDDGECWVAEYSPLTSECHIIETSSSLTAAKFSDRPGWNVYIKECFNPSINFEKVPNSNVSQDKGFPIEKYCDLNEPPGDDMECIPVAAEVTVLTSSNVSDQPPNTTSILMLESTTFEPTPPPTAFSYNSSEVLHVSSPPISSTGLETSVFTLPDVLESTVALTSITVEMTPALLTPSEYTILTEPASVETLSSEVLPIETMTPIINSTEINLMTKTSVTNVSKTATIDATNCDCTCIIRITSTREQQEFMSSIIHDLEIDKKNVSKNRHKYQSVNVDRRWQTLSFGYLGVTILLLIFGGIIVMDAGTLWRDFTMMAYNLRQFFCPRHNQMPEAGAHCLPRNSQILEAEAHVSPRSIKPRINLHDLERYSVMAAEVWPNPGSYQRLSRQGIRPGKPDQSNRDRLDPRIGVHKMNIYHST